MIAKVYDWARVLAALKRLAEAFPEQFPGWVLIGGGACWFYREALKAAADPEFPVPSYDQHAEEIWLSKDLDFMGLTEAEATDLFQAPFKEETHTITFGDIEVDFLEEGLHLTLGSVLQNVREVRIGGFGFLVAAPEILYMEKCALVNLKQRPQDQLHHGLLAQFLKHEFCADLRQPNLDAADWVARARVVKTADLEFFLRDPHFQTRLRDNIAALNPTTHKPILHWAKHHLGLSSA